MSEEADVWAQMRSLEHGWDGDGAPPPSAESIRDAVTIERVLKSHGLYAEPEADAQGGVALWLFVPDVQFKGACVAVRNDGARILILDDRVTPTEPEVEEFKLSFPSILKIKKILGR